MALTAIDRLDISGRLAQVSMDVDFGRAEAYALNFTRHASLSIRGLQVEGDHAGTHMGREAIAESTRILYEGAQGHCRHWIGPLVISETATGAASIAYFQVLRIGQVPQAGVILTGVYYDDLVRDGDMWLVDRRLCSIDPQPENGAVSSDVLVMARDRVVGAL